MKMKFSLLLALLTYSQDTFAQAAVAPAAAGAAARACARWPKLCATLSAGVGGGVTLVGQRAVNEASCYLEQRNINNDCRVKLGIWTENTAGGHRLAPGQITALDGIISGYHRVLESGRRTAPGAAQPAPAANRPAADRATEIATDPNSGIGIACDPIWTELQICANKLAVIRFSQDSATSPAQAPSAQPPRR